MISITSSKTKKNKVLEHAQESNVKKKKIPDINIKIHQSYRTIVAVSDSDLIGKKFEEGIRQLDVRENFYKDKEVDKEEAIKIIQFQASEDATFNIVGKESTDAAIKAGIITKENIDTIQNIPFSLTLI